MRTRENVRINSAEGNQGSRSGRSEGRGDASSDRKLKSCSFFLWRRCAFHAQHVSLHWNQRKGQKKKKNAAGEKSSAKIQKSAPKFLNILYVSGLLCRGDLQGREPFERFSEAGGCSEVSRLLINLQSSASRN